MQKMRQGDQFQTTFYALYETKASGQLISFSIF